MPTFLAVFGSGFRDESGEIVETDTVAVSYYDSRACMLQDLRACDFEPIESAGVLILEDDAHAVYRGSPPPDGTPTGDFSTVSYGAAPGDTPPGHEWCPACGDLVSHGDGDDGDHFECDGDSCDAPASETVAAGR
jgi:hypothetical protein